MDSPTYEYRGLMAASWDLLRGDTRGWPARAFYREVIEDSGQPALEIGRLLGVKDVLKVERQD